MRNFRLLLLILIMSCKSENLIPLEQEITLLFNTPVSFEDGSKSITINVTSIQDNRCPANANCVRAGEAIVEIEINNMDYTICLECNQELNFPDHIQSGERTYTIIEVSPFPNLSQPSTQEGKTVKLQVQ